MSIYLQVSAPGRNDIHHVAFLCNWCVSNSSGGGSGGHCCYCCCICKCAVCFVHLCAVCVRKREGKRVGGREGSIDPCFEQLCPALLCLG